MASNNEPIVANMPTEKDAFEKEVALTGSALSSTSNEAADSKDEFDQKLALKVDLYLLVPMLFLNFLSLMGRTNIGAALIQQLPHDLKLNATRVFLVITIPLIPLILFEIPSNLAMRYLEKSHGISYMRYLSVITILLGTCSPPSNREFVNSSPRRTCYFGSGL